MTILLLVVIIEALRPRWLWRLADRMTEGFETIAVGDSAFWTRWMPRRGDVGMDPEAEENGYQRELRYFQGYADVQRTGQALDFCRMVQSKSDPDDVFFACALAGTDGLSSLRYRTPSQKAGFELSRDDYINGGYCRILKTGPETFEAKCLPFGDTTFKSLAVDPTPPLPIQRLLSFYEGIQFWLRFDDDMLDYAKNLIVTTAGAIKMDETPRPPTTEGLRFDGSQFLRLGDAKDLTFGQRIQLRYLRALTFWVYFDEFTNNAHIIDFGRGAGRDNVFVGIVGRGNPGVSDQKAERIEDPALATVPTKPSGAACTQEVSPQRALATSAADVTHWTCPLPELFGRIMPPTTTTPEPTPAGEATTADLLYEVWNEKQRKLHIQVKNVFPLREWVHIAIAADDNDPWRPRLRIYRNGEEVHREEAAWLPQTNDTTHNYIGKSNWSNVTSPSANPDELFKGRLFDLRGYQTAMTPEKVRATVDWGRDRLGVSDTK